MRVVSLMPIHWFGDRKAYSQSAVKIVTVGLNPSGKEFKASKTSPESTVYRFPNYNSTNVSTLEMSLNEYFKIKPYTGWFNSFEHILAGMDASYWNGKKDNIAIHTDFCTPWATDPSWSHLSDSEKNRLTCQGIPAWETLIKDLAPDIILFSIPDQYIRMLNLTTYPQPLVTYNKTKCGNQRKNPKVINYGDLCGTMVVFGKSWDTPFGDIDFMTKHSLGKNIMTAYKIKANSSRINKMSKIIIP